MKTTKKVLSVFLAVIMIMSSMSVCFGTISFAATDAVNDFVAAVKCDAMKNFNIDNVGVNQTGTMNNKNSEITRAYTYSVTTYKDYTDMVAVLSAFDAAWRSLYNQTYLTHSNSSNCANKKDWCIDAADVLAALKADIGTSYDSLNSTYHLGDLLGCLLSMDGVSHRNETNDSHSSLRDDKCTCNQGVYNKFTVSLSMLNYLKSFTDPASIDKDNISLSYTCTFAMSRQNYDTGSVIKTRHHHLAVNTLSRAGGTEPAEEAATNKATLTAMKSALAANSAYLSKTTIAGVHEVSKNPDTLNAAATAIETAYNNVNTTFGTDAATLYNHYFSKNYIDHGTETTNLVALLKKAATIAGYKSACDTIAKDYAIYTAETYKTYTSTEVNALYNELKTAYEAYKAADDTMEAEIAAYYGINGYIADIPAVLDALLAYYYEIFLGSIDERAFGDNNNGYISEYSSWTVEDIDNDAVTSADILTALNEVTLDIDTITSDASDADIQGYFGMSRDSLLATLTNVKTHLEDLGYYAGLNDELYAQYATFTNNVANVINADSSKLYGVLSGYEQWHKDLQSFFTTWSAEVGTYKDLLEDNLQATMNEYMREAYAALKARVVTQITSAHDLYKVYYDMYGNNVTMASLTYFNTLKRSIEAIEHNAYNWMLSDHWTYGTKLDQDSIDKYNALQVIYGQYGTFVANRGFNTYTQTVVDTVREDTDKDIARENENIDTDPQGEYKVADEDVEAIIDLLEAALKDEKIKTILGNLINKDEDGNPTGEKFDLAALLNKLINDNLYSDNLINTIIQFLYPLVAQAFLDVWEGIDPIIWIYDMPTGMSIAPEADVKVILELYDVDQAIYNVGIALSPAMLAEKLASNSTYASKFPGVITDLSAITAKTRYNADGDYIDPWKDAGLFVDAINEETGEPVIDEETNEVKQIYKLNWGVDEATDKKAAFIDAACAALSGLEPLLYALLLNQSYANAPRDAAKPRGNQIGTGFGDAAASGLGALLGDMVVTVDPITLVLEISANDGYDNVLAPLFELLGLENIPHSEDMKTTRDFLEKGLFAMIDQLIGKLANNPVKTILDIVPNLVYALEADLLAPILDLLAIDISYYADAYYKATKGSTKITDGNLSEAMKSKEPIAINVGEMVNLEEMGLNLSGGLAGILEMLNLNIPLPDVSVLATAGKLIWKDTNRSRWTYSYQPAGVSGKAAHIEANRADVLEYLVKWALGNLPGLLSAFNVDTSAMSETVSAILTGISANADASTAAIVELLNQEVYNTLEAYDWYDGGFTSSATDLDFTPADEIYLNPGNDWTEEKADYLYDNLEAIVGAVLTMAKVDLDEETAEVDGSLEGVVGGAIDGLLSDKTLTALARLLKNLDLNALLNKDKTPEEAAKSIDVNALIKEYLGLDLAAVAATYAAIPTAEENEEYVHPFGVDAGTRKFADVLLEMLAPLKPVLDFILAGKNIKLTINGEAVELIGYDGYNNAIIPLLEALGCEVAANPENALKATLDALLAKIDALTTNTAENAKDGLIYGVIDMLPGVLYFLSSNGLATTVRNLLQPVYVILDTIRPVFDVDLAALIAGIEVNGQPLGLDLDNLHTAALLDLVANLTGLDLSELQVLIYDVCEVIGVDYSDTAKSTLQKVWKKGAYTTDFDQSDMLTVVLSFLLEWITVDENAAALDEMLNTKGIVANIEAVFTDASGEIKYSDPDWMYWFDTEADFNDYVNGNKTLPNTLLALEYPNNWDELTAEYVAENLPALVDEIVALIEINGVKHEDLDALLDSLLADYISADTINDLLDMLKGVLANVEDTLLDVGYLLDVDLVGLKNYTCEKEIKTATEFAAELAYILDTYAPTIVDLLFFGDDIRLAKKSDNKDTIVINGGLGYEKGLALILEALGCDVPAADKATTANVLAALGERVDYILKEGNTVNAVIDLLPNLVYFLNANGLGVAVDNLLQPVYVIVDKINALGVLEEPISIEDLIKIEKEDGTEVKINLAALTLEYIVNLVETLTGLNLEAVDEILVDFCLGKLEKAEYTYKMTAERKDVITLVLTVALLVVETEGNDAVIDELIGKEMIAAIKDIISGASVEYVAPEWDYALAEDNALIDYAITYPNNWNEVTAEYVAENLDEIVDSVISLIEIKGVKHESVSALVDSMVNIYTPETLGAIQKALADLIGGLDEDLKDLVDIGLGAADRLLGADVNGLINYDVSGVKDKATFVEALTGMLMEVEGLVDWLLLGEDYEFFVDENDEEGYQSSEAIVTITGAHGYAEGLALLLEALGCTDLPTVYDKETIDTEATVKAVLTSVTNRIDDILSNPVEKVVELLPNIFYFLNTNGVAAVIDNTIAAIMALVGKLDAFGVEVDINELVNLAEILKIEDKYAEGEEKISLDNLAMSDILKAVSLMTNLDITMFEEVLVGFALGQVTTYTSVSEEVGTPKKMTYKDEFDKHDMLTVAATLALLTLSDKKNEAVVSELLGADVYKTIINVLNMEEFVPEMKEMNWILTEHADTNEAVSGMETSELYEGWGYGPLYTEEMAQYIADNFGRFIDNIIFLLGIELNGTQVESLQEIIDELLGGTLYTTDTLNSVLDLLRKLPSFITDFAGADLTKHVNEILKTSIGVDLTYWNTYVPAEVTDRDGFVAELCRMLEPFYPVLEWLLADEDFAFFVDGANKGDDMIVLHGASGYAYGIIPILEALGCEGVLTATEYEAAVKADGSVLLTSILNPLLNKVDTILYAEENGSTIADEVLKMLPALVYFINSNGLDTSIKNILNAVYTVLNAIEPVTGEINLYDLIGLDLENLTFEEIIAFALEKIGEATGYDLSSFSADYVAELTVGNVVSFETKNDLLADRTAYTMEYSEEESGSASAMVTVLLRLALTFLACDENQQKVLAILAEQFNMDAEAQKYLAGVFEAVAECEIGTHIGMDKACAVIYYLFYSADIGADFAATGIKDLNAEWQKIFEELGKTAAGTDPTVGNLLSRFLDVTMKDILEDVLNSDGVAPNGFIKFFQRIAEWFKNLITWIQNLFN